MTFGVGSRSAPGHLGGLRYQPPARSPLELRHVARAILDLASTLGDTRDDLQRRIAARFSAHHVVLCSSGTHALELAIRTARRLVGLNAPVALPAFTCYDVATAAVAAKGRLLLYDIDPHTLSPDVSSCVAALRRGARVLVVTPLYGYPPDWEGITEVAEAHGALVVEDAAQGHGASWRGHPLGTLGSLSVLSFGRGKGWTGVRGGALLARGAPLSRILAGHRPRAPVSNDAVRVLVGALAQSVFSGPGLYWLPASIPALELGRTVYHVPTPGRRMTRLAAALALATEADADRVSEARRREGRALLDDLPVRKAVRPVRPLDRDGAGFLRAPVLLAQGMEGFGSQAEARRLGVEASYPSTLADLVPLRPQLDSPVTRCPGAEYLADHLATLPTHGCLSGPERDHLLRLVDGYGRAARRPSAAKETGLPRRPATTP